MSPIEDTLRTPVRVWPTGPFGIPYGPNRPTWAAEVAQRVIDRCLQLFGGYGYMTEYPISRAWVDNRVAKIYGGSNEIMKEIIGRRLVSGD